MASAGPIRVMVVDDHPIMRNGLRDVLEASGRVDVVGQAGDGEEAVRTVERLRPEVIVMDVLMPRKDGIDACREIMELLPDTRVLMLTASSSMDAVIEAVAAGATGYLPKYSQPDELVETVVAVAEGRNADTGAGRAAGLRYGPRFAPARRAAGPGSAYRCGATNPHALRKRQTLCPNRQGEGQEHRDRT